MIFDSINTNPCIVAGAGTGPNGSGSGSGTGGTPDPRCSDATFAAANPDICGSTAYLVLKPSASLISRLGSVQFTVFSYSNNIESPVTDSLQFISSDPTIFVVGVSSGAGTGVAAGQVVVTVTRNGQTATATVTVLDSSIGCNQTHVATAILIDDSNSMSLGFGGSYASRLAFAKAIATSYCGNILLVDNVPKDTIKIWSFDDTPTQVSSGFISDSTQLGADVASVTQTANKTDLAQAITTAANDLIAQTADEHVLIIISDGEQTDAPSEQNVLAAASLFTAAGGIIVCIGCRAALGFDLLERAATGGFFFNAIPANVADSFLALSFLKSSVCAGLCVPAGDTTTPTAALNYSSFENWSVIAGQVNLLGNGFEDFLPGNGLYVEMAEDNNPATLESIDAFPIESGDTYAFSVSLAGNNQLAMPQCQLKLYIRDTASAASDPNLFEHVFPVNWTDDFATASASFTAQYSTTVKLFIQYIVPTPLPTTIKGCLIDDVQFTDTTTLVNLLTDTFDTENEVYTPPACGASAAIAAISNPATPLLAFLNYGGGAQVSGETYKYAVSYKTAYGETAASAVASTASLTPVTVNFQATQVYGILPSPTADPGVTAIRLWRNDSSGSSALYLLAEISAENTSYIDLENHTQFAARANTGTTAPVSNTTGKATGALGTGSLGCYTDSCSETAAIGAQAPDPTPLPDIEGGAGGSTGGGFTSTQQVCVQCPAGSSSSLTPAMTSNTAPTGICSTSDGSTTAFYAFDKTFASDTNPLDGWWKPGSLPAWIQYQLPAAATCTNYAVSALPPGSDPAGTPTGWQLQGSNDGSTWNTLDTQAAQVFSSANGYINQYSIAAPAPYLYYRLNVTATHEELAGIIPILEIVLYGTSAGFTICKSATASGSSQGAADAAATQAATQAANAALAALGAFGCVPVWSATAQYTANCPCGSLGSQVIQSVTYVSTISQTDANTQAQAAAQAAANSLLSCEQSNNAQVINIPAFGQASVYPSVKYVSDTGTVAGATVTLKSISCKDFSDFDVILLSPSGRVVALKLSCGQSGATINNVTIVFDDAGATGIPPAAPPTNNTHYKPTQNVGFNFPGCPPVQPWLDTLAGLIGDVKTGSWSLWIRVAEQQPGNVVGTISGWDLTLV